ncbi:hypothetical protein M758_UG238500 [Ceratodon purpureus]|nr:hypothetical protein M758_UG238500 [Ceratodon purpureus]
MLSCTMSSRSRVQAVMLDIRNDEGDSTPTEVEVNSWVFLMPGKRGGHAKDARKHGGSSVYGSFKAQVLGFRFNANSTAVTKIRVRHAYTQRQLLDLRKEPVVTLGGANCKCSSALLIFIFSNFKLLSFLCSTSHMKYFNFCTNLYLSESSDWVDPKSVINIMMVVHADIGEMYRGGRTHKEMLDDSLFFYDARYYPRTGRQQFGRVEQIPLPSFDDPMWPLRDMLTTETFRAKLRCDFISSMKPNTGSRQTHLQWVMPITVMVDLFSCAQSIHRCKTLFFFKGVTEELMSSLMDKGWNSKVTMGGDVVRCTIDPATIMFRYHIVRSTLYTNFQFNRERFLVETGWQPIDQVSHVDVVTVKCEYEDMRSKVEVGRDWQLTNLREEIDIPLGADYPSEFTLWILNDGHPPHKVNRRNEAKHTAANVLPPKRLKIVSK